MNKGDYVFATKYNDGDLADGWAVGFYDKSIMSGERHLVVDDKGNQFRRNGFRRVEVIPPEIGKDLIEAAQQYSSAPELWPPPGSLNIWCTVALLKEQLNLS